jgi:cytochrome c oxidase subunit 3
VGESETSLALAHGAMLEESPFGIESKKLVIWLFIIADAATFGAILFGYGYLRVVMTLVLLTSSLTMLGAVGAAQAERRDSTVKWLGATVFLGALFAALHLREWFKMFAEGWSPSANPEGGSVLFGASFFSITGLHLLHVIGGVAAMTVVALMFRRGRLTPGHIETTGLYWHFVDLVWMFVFPLMYLMNAH